MFAGETEAIVPGIGSGDGFPGPLRRGGHHQADDRRGRGPADRATHDGHQRVPAGPDLLSQVS